MSFSKVMSKVALVAGFGALSLVGAEPAQAKTATQNLTITVTVNSSCLLALSAPMALPQFNQLSGSTITNNFSVNCTLGTDYAVLFSDGANFSGGRRMQGGTDPLNFVPYTLTYLGTELASSGLATIAGTGTGAAVPFAIVATVAPSLTLANDSYTDLVVATATY